MFHSQGNHYYHTVNNVSGPVHCIAQSDVWLAIGCGKAVQLVKQATIGGLFHIPASLEATAIHSYLGNQLPSSRPAQVSRTGRRAPGTHGTLPSLLGQWQRHSTGDISGPWRDVSDDFAFSLTRSHQWLIVPGILRPLRSNGASALAHLKCMNTYLMRNKISHIRNIEAVLLCLPMRGFLL